MHEVRSERQQLKAAEDAQVYRQVTLTIAVVLTEIENRSYGEDSSF